VVGGENRNWEYMRIGNEERVMRPSTQAWPEHGEARWNEYLTELEGQTFEKHHQPPKSGSAIHVRLK